MDIKTGIIIGLVLSNIVTAVIIVRKTTAPAYTFTNPEDTCCKCPGNCYSPSCLLSPPFSTRVAKEMVSKYRSNHWAITNNWCSPFRQNKVDASGTVLFAPDGTTQIPFNDPSVINDARSAWFNLDTLKAFINTIETMTCKRGENCPKLQLGIRIYYAEYPTDTAYLDTVFGITDPRYADMHTLLMIPTYNDGKNDVDYDPYTLPQTSCMPSSVFDTLQPIVALAPTAKINARNHGGLIPPPYKYGEDWSSTGAKFMNYVDVVNDGRNQYSSNRKMQ